MRAAKKPRRSPEVIPEITSLPQGRYVEGHVTVLRRAGAVFEPRDGRAFELRVPRHVDRRWLAAAVKLAPVEAIAVRPEGVARPILWCVFAGDEHAVLDESFEIDARRVSLKASESITIRTEKGLVALDARGEVRVRGRNITSRASNVNRVKGGAVRLN